MVGRIIFKKDNSGKRIFVIKDKSEKIYTFNSNSLADGVDIHSLKGGMLVEFDTKELPDGSLRVINLTAFVPSNLRKPMEKDTKDVAIHALKEYFDQNSEAILPEISRIFSENAIDYKSYGYAKFKEFLIENFSECLIFNTDEPTVPVVSFNNNYKVAPLKKAVPLKIKSVRASVDFDALCDKVSSLYSEQRYDEILMLEELKGFSPVAVPLRITEMIINACAHEIGDTTNVSFNDFDRLLIRSTYKDELFREKNNKYLLKLGIERCILNVDENQFRKLYNLVIQHYTVNSWMSLAERFCLCKNEYANYFYVASAFLDNLNTHTIVDSFLDQFGESIPDRLFMPVFDLLVSRFAPAENFGKCITRALAIAIDNGNEQMFFEIISKHASDTMNAFRLFEEADNSPSVEIIMELMSSCSPQLVQKFINYLLYSGKIDINSRLAWDLFAEIIYSFNRAYLEEIIYIDIYQELDHKAKETALISSFDDIVYEAEENEKLYLLACYIVKYISSTSIPKIFIDLKEKLISRYSTLIEQKPEIYPHVSKIFSLDSDGFTAFTEKRQPYLSAQYKTESLDDDEVSALIDELIAQENFMDLNYVLERLFETERAVLKKPEYAERTVNALVEAEKFGKAVKFVLNCDAFEEGARAVEIMKILRRNFTKYNLTDRAYEIFDTEFTDETAEKYALNNFTANNGAPIILMAIYSRKNDWARVCYIYSIYREKLKTGNRELFKQLNRLSDKPAIVKTHYAAIRFAFGFYGTQEIIPFLKWCGKITIPDFRQYNQGFELYKPEIDQLIRTPVSRDAWVKLITKITEQVHQHTTTFGYTAQCFHAKIFRPYYEHDEQNLNFYKYLYELVIVRSPKESQNFLILNRELLDILPEAYYIQLNSFVQKNTEVLQEYTTRNFEDAQEFYTALTEKYEKTGSTVYLELAMNVYITFDGCTNPCFEKYFDFTASAEDKAPLFRLLFTLCSKNRNKSDVYSLIRGATWNCAENERGALNLLRVLFTDKEALPEDIQALDEWENAHFYSDCTSMLVSYPKISRYNSLINSDETISYKLTVLKYVLTASFSMEIYWDIGKRYWDTCDVDRIYDKLDALPNGINSLLSFERVCYAAQSNAAVVYGVEYISRRYFNLLLIDLYLGGCKAVFDEGILELMSTNSHSLLIGKAYDSFKQSLLLLLSDETGLSDSTKRLAVLSLMLSSSKVLIKTTQLDELLENQKALELYSVLVGMTAYPGHAQSCIYAFLHSDEDKRGKILKYTQTVLPHVYKLLAAYVGSGCAEEFTQMLETAALCVNNNEISNALYAKKEYYTEGNYPKYREILINIIVSTNFSYNIIRNAGNKGRKRLTDLQDIPIYKDVFEALGNLSAFWYICAVSKALANDREAAVSLYKNVTNLEHLPGLWREETENLKKYLNGVIPVFKTREISNAFDAELEQSLQSVSFVTFSKNKTVDKNDATEALMQFLDTALSDGDRIDAAKLVIDFMQSPKNFDDIVRTVRKEHPDAKNLTYNAFIFNYGLLILKAKSDSVNVDAKLDISLELFECLNALNDSNKRYFEPLLKRRFGELLTERLQGRVVSYGKWITSFEKIRAAVHNLKMETEGYPEFEKTVSDCISFENSLYTRQEKIEFLSALVTNVCECEFTRTFLTSVHNEINTLKASALLNIKVLSSKVENNSIFLILENPASSSVAVNLDSKSNRDSTHKVYFDIEITPKGSKEPSMRIEQPCSGFVDVLRPGNQSGEKVEIPLPEDCSEFTARITAMVNGVAICRNRECESFTVDRANETKMPQPSGSKMYETATCAFRKGVNDGFGRTSEKQWIMENMLLQKAACTLYGPSRVGKSSLLQYAMSELADRYKDDEKILALTDREAPESIYIFSVADSSNPGDYNEFPQDSDKDALEFLFVNTIKRCFADAREKIKGKELSEDALQKIDQILESSLPVSGKYRKLSAVLKSNNAEFWLFLDEFQQIVQKWDIKDNSDFVGFLDSLATDDGIYGIRVMLCGSDELVKIMESNHETWSRAIEKTKKCGIGQMDEQGFFEMLKDRRIWGDTHPFTDYALRYLFRYTGGNAMYGKLIGNKILSRIKNGKYQGRSMIYPSDIAECVADTLNEQNHDISNNSDRNEIIINITKNLNAENRYLHFIAHKMNENPDILGVSLAEILAAFPVTARENPQEIKVSLAVCCTRGILKKIDGEDTYKFSTVFFHSYYSYMAEKNGVETEDSTDIMVSSETSGDLIDEFTKRVGVLTPEKQASTLSGVLVNADKEALQKIHDFIGNRIHVEGDVVQGNKNTQNIKIDQIANSVIGLSDFISGVNEGRISFDAEKVNEQLGKMPRLELLPAGTDRAPDDDIAVFDTDSYVETVEEGVKQAVKDIRQWARENVDVLEDMSVDDPDYIFSLPEQDCDSILTALYLRWLFDDILSLSAQNMHVDYAPVTIMLSKTLERTLKKLHLPLYLNKSVWINDVNNYNPDPQKRFPITFLHSTIGTYTTALRAMFNTDDNDPEKQQKCENRDRFVEKTGTETRKWISYTRDLFKAKDIRNKTAHIDPVSQIDCDEFINLFFRSKLLQNTIDFVKGK